AHPDLRSFPTRRSSDLSGGEDSAAGGGAGSIFKLVWANWHRSLGEVAMAVAGADGLRAEAAPYELTGWQRIFLFSRADTIYGGRSEEHTSELQSRENLV